MGGISVCPFTVWRTGLISVVVEKQLSAVPAEAPLGNGRRISTGYIGGQKNINCARAEYLRENSPEKYSLRQEPPAGRILFPTQGNRLNDRPEILAERIYYRQTGK